MLLLERRLKQDFLEFELTFLNQLFNSLNEIDNVGNFPETYHEVNRTIEMCYKCKKCTCTLNYGGFFE